MHARTRGGPRNRLAHETSPYLLQHADNPVDWYPWGDEAIAKARELDRPILLSIGYSACHWCHVMAHESFEDEATAAVMNRLFVNVKVDREERPDIDKVYQLAHQLLTRRAGGWPLTMFLSPSDLTPFFGGTYFPREPRHGLPAFRDLLERVAGFYRDERASVDAQNAAVRAVLREAVPAAPGAVAPSAELLARARRDLEAAFDERFGGFGPAPKFPHAPGLELLLRAWHASTAQPEPDLKALHMAAFTLRRMAEGGIFDQLGGGFCRYSVDPFWMIPHFEKMLYDNGALLAVTAQAAVATGDEVLQRAALATAGWALGEMRSPEGGFYAALDADSEGHEGRYYAWDRAEVESLLAPDEFRVLARHYGLDRAPNFEDRWHLHVFVPIEDVAGELGIAADEARRLLASARGKLLAQRATRVRPGLDDKRLTAWNGLMIRGLAVSGRLLARPEHVDAAQAAADFLRSHCWREGALFASWKDGRARFPGYLDDYAFVLDGLVELLQARYRAEDLRFACALADALLARFLDRAGGGFWFTAEGHEPPLFRPKSFADESVPSGNGVAARALARLGWLVGETRYLEAAEATVRAGAAAAERAPEAHATLLTALEEQLDPPEVVVVRGAPAEVARWTGELARTYAPRRLVFGIPAAMQGLPEALAAKAPRGEVVAYACRGPACSEPIARLDDLLKAR